MALVEQEQNDYSIQSTEEPNYPLSEEDDELYWRHVDDLIDRAKERRLFDEYYN